MDLRLVCMITNFIFTFIIIQVNVRGEGMSTENFQKHWSEYIKEMTLRAEEQNKNAPVIEYKAESVEEMKERLDDSWIKI